jgi:methionine synthase II (cobalamin-independent)
MGIKKLKEKLSLLSTAIGSLPHNDPQKAVDLIFETFPEFPVWPQLSNVNINEDMIIQYTQGIPGAVYDENDNRWYLDPESEDFYEKLEEFYLDYESIISDGDMDLLDKYGISGEFSSSLPLFFEKLKKAHPIAIKGQITGPFTWGTSLIDRDKKCAFYDETLREIVVKGLTLKALWQVYNFKKYSPNSIPVIFLDEPTMSQYGTSAFITVSREDIIGSINEIADILKQHGAVVAIHCCGKTDWSLITESNVDMINFDGFFFAESLGLYAKEIEKFLKKGGFIAWGIVPTLDEDSLLTSSPDSLEEKFEIAKSYLVNKGIDQDLIIESSIITPSCGAGGLSEDMAISALDFTAGLANSLRKKYLGRAEVK